MAALRKLLLNHFEAKVVLLPARGSQTARDSRHLYHGSRALFPAARCGTGNARRRNCLRLYPHFRRPAEQRRLFSPLFAGGRCGSCPIW